jgi:thiamine biosynthesis lipoprotein
MAASLQAALERARALEHERAAPRRVLSGAQLVLGTEVTFEVLERTVSRAALDRVSDWLRWADATLSGLRPDSATSRLADGSLAIENCPREVMEVLELCNRLTAQSGGHFSPTWNGRWDPAGILKGWSMQRASALLRCAGSLAHRISGAGNVRTVGEPAPGVPWRITVVHQHDAGAEVSVLRGRDLAVATSRSAERGGRVRDPFSGLPASGLASITVVGGDLPVVEGCAMAALAMGPGGVDWIAGQPGLEAFAVTPDGRAVWTRGYPAVGLVPLGQ